jgi:hemoglobin-like flavoprotein
MTDPTQMFAELKQFIGFTDADAANLRRLAPLFAEHGRAVTDAFYDRLTVHPDTSALIAGRVDRLKQTHARWLGELFAGDYGDAYLADRWRVGLTHVRAGIKPHWVDAVASILRAVGTELIARHVDDPDLRTASTQSYLRILDLDMMLIDLAYGEERLDRLSQFTGMSRKLIERCVLQNKP